MKGLIWSEATKEHMKAHPGMSDLAEKAYQIAANSGILAPFCPISIKFDSVIGESGCVDAPASGIITVQKRPGRKNWSRVTLEKPRPTKFVTIILHRDCQTLITAYCGEGAPREPWDKSMNDGEKITAIEFWRRHALTTDSSLGAIYKMSYEAYVNGEDPPGFYAP